MQVVLIAPLQYLIMLFFLLRMFQLGHQIAQSSSKLEDLVFCFCRWLDHGWSTWAVEEHKGNGMEEHIISVCYWKELFKEALFNGSDMC